MVFEILSLPVPRLSDNLTCSPIFSIQSWEDVLNLGSNDSSNKRCQFWSRKPQQSPACSSGGTPATHQHSFKVDIPVVRLLSFLCNRTKSNLPTKKRQRAIHQHNFPYIYHTFNVPSFPIFSPSVKTTVTTDASVAQDHGGRRQRLGRLERRERVPRLHEAAQRRGARLHGARWLGLGLGAAAAEDGAVWMQWMGHMADPSGRGFGLFGDQNGRVVEK